MTAVLLADLLLFPFLIAGIEHIDVVPVSDVAADHAILPRPLIFFLISGGVVLLDESASPCSSLIHSLKSRWVGEVRKEWGH